MADFNAAPRDIARVLDFYYQSFRDDVALMTGRDLSGSRVSPTQISDIKDLNGNPLFRDYAILGGDGEKIGLVRSSAVGPQLPLIDAIMVGKLLYDDRTVEATVIAQARTDYPGATFTSKGLVCYGYPRVGVRLTVTAGAAPFDAVYDAHAIMRVREIRGAVPASEAGHDLESTDELEGEPFYSYSANFPEAGAEDPFASDWTRALDFIRLASGAPAAEPSSLESFGEIASSGATENVTAEDRMPAIRGITLPLPLIGQEHPVWCAVATGQMILNYLGITGVTQREIATAFRTGPLGTTNANMIAGLSRLTGGRWSAALDEAPDVDKAAQYLGGFLPGKSGIPGHARLLRGWREYTYIDPKTGRPFLKSSFYLVNDPYPTNYGQYAMEAVNKPIPDFYRNLLTLIPPTS